MKKYFNIKELNPRGYELSEEQLKNLNILIDRLSVIRHAWGKPMIVTSGVRSVEDQMRINPKAPMSRHLLGAAVDIHDRDGELKEWLKSDLSILEKANLYCEDFAFTKTWVHFQILPPKSGKRVFKP